VSRRSYAGNILSEGCFSGTIPDHRRRHRHDPSNRPMGIARRMQTNTEWLDAGLPAVPVAVNISSLEFRSEHFLEGVQVALKNSNLDSNYLELELTETVLMRHAESTAYALRQLKAIGVRLAVDDLYGYSA